jgi:hypothetical protein
MLSESLFQLKTEAKIIDKGSIIRASPFTLKKADTTTVV